MFLFGAPVFSSKLVRGLVKSNRLLLDYWTTGDSRTEFGDACSRARLTRGLGKRFDEAHLRTGNVTVGRESSRAIPPQETNERKSVCFRTEIHFRIPSRFACRRLTGTFALPSELFALFRNDF